MVSYAKFERERERERVREINMKMISNFFRLISPRALDENESYTPNSIKLTQSLYLIFIDFLILSMP